MFFLSINGPSCSGKSTIIKEMMKTQDSLFHLPYDSLKWLFSKYNSKTHYQKVQEFVFSVAVFALEQKYDIISDSSLHREDGNRLIDLVRNHGYKIIEINLSADFSVLEKRFDERVSSALANPNSRISNTSKERFKELVEIFEKEKNDQAIEIRTDNQTIEKVIKNILEFI
jgi:predicted kinase